MSISGLSVSINGVHQVHGNHFEYKGCMLSGVPNFAFVDEAGTRHSDLVCRYVCRVLKAMDSKRSSICCPFQSDFLFPSASPQMMTTQESTRHMSSRFVHSSLVRLIKVSASFKWA